MQHHNVPESLAVSRCRFGRAIRNFIGQSRSLAREEVVNCETGQAPESPFKSPIPSPYT
jgi:hypothetical protein